MQQLKKFLKNKKVLITVGSTREHLDPVRFLSNASSGKMGLALGNLLHGLGSKITFICGPGILSPKKMRHIPIISALDLLKAVKKEFPKCDIFISACAVSDYRPRLKIKTKLKKENKKILLELLPNPDVLATVAKNKKGQFCVGFALENSIDIRLAQNKMGEKNCDLMVLNDLSSMGGEAMKASLLLKNGTVWNLGKLKKKECAKKICQAILKSQPK